MPTKLQLNGGPDSSHCVNFFTARIHLFSRMNPTLTTPSAKMKRNQNSQEGGNSSTSPHHSTETLTEESENYLSKHQAVQKELKENVRNLEEWLKETESILKEPLKFNQMWSQEAIDNKMQEIQVLHRDIESRSQLIKTVLEQCTDLDASRKLRKRKGSPAATRLKISVVLSVGKIIEKRWHCLWLRSLEWQCFLEQFTSCKGTSKVSLANFYPGPRATAEIPNPSEKPPKGTTRQHNLKPGQHLQSSGDQNNKMNISSCSDSSSLIDGISSSAEAIFEAENIKNSSSSPQQNSQRHSTPSKTGLRFIVADSEDEELQTDLTSLSASSKCETTFSRTTFANNAGYPNCGTYFVQHISDEECYTDNGNNLNSLDENDNTSSAYASPNSIRKLVRGAEKLVLAPPGGPVDDSDVDYRPSSSLVALRPQKEKKTKRSHSFHESILKLPPDFLVSSEDDMDCERDSHNPSLKDASSLSQLVDSVVAEVQQALFSDEELDLDAEKLGPKIQDDLHELRASAANEEEELSEFWDQEKYLSEHNYDEPIDVDRTLKLLNFGDDYSKFIDSMSDEFSDLEQHNQTSSSKPQQPRNKRKVRRSTVKGSRYDSMSDSESDDAWKAVLLSRTKLNEVKQRLRNLEEDDQFINNSVELTILKDVCYENVDCILKLLDESGAENSTVIVLKKTERSFKGLLKQWQETLQMIVKRLQLSESHTKIMTDVKAFEKSLHKASLPLNSGKPLIHRKEDLECYIEDLKNSILSLTQNKSDLFRVNVDIHNFLAELSCCPGVVFNTPPSSLGRKDHHHLRQQQLMSMTAEANNHHHPKILLPSTLHNETPITKGLKEKVTALYSTWDEAFHKTNTQLVNAQTTYANLLQFEIESKRLGTIQQSGEPATSSAQRLPRSSSSRKKQDSFSLTEDSGISESCDDSEEAILTKMRLLARDLEQKLSLDSNLVQEIAQTLKTSTSDLEERLLEYHHSSSNQGRLRTSNADRNCTGTQTNESCCNEVDENVMSVEKSKPKSSWFGRLLRFFLPVQFFFLMMFFYLAWHSTPDHHIGFYHHGCEGSRFHFLYPQLKYINGPPPI